ncbi:MAG TPA: hypothetical protein VJ810_29905 [Blastocatellia bacterium]|nr:hypothetical protein [Blastocatellia bacterium]
MVYLIHLNKPYTRMQHYVGTAGPEPIGARATRFKRAIDAGLTWRISRTWPGEDAEFEVRLRNTAPSLAQFCRDCSGEAAYSKAANEGKKRVTGALRTDYIEQILNESEQINLCLNCSLPACIGIQKARYPMHMEARQRWYGVSKRKDFNAVQNNF